MTDFDNQQQTEQMYVSEKVGEGGLDNVVGIDFNQEMRRGFIRKVYGILAAQLILTTFFICLSFVPNVKFFMANNSAASVLVWICLVIIIGILISLFFCLKVARRVPINYILLGVFTVCESYCLLFVCSYYSPEVVILAMAGTAGITVALTAYAWTTKEDFTYLGSSLFCGVFLLMYGGVVGGVYYDRYGYNLFYCLGGLIIYSIYLIYDTQLIMGKCGIEYQIDDYIVAAIQIYIDIVQIFLFLLSLLGGK